MAPRLLITGFGAFPGVPANPSQLVVERLEAAGWSPPGVQARYAVLPTTWAGALDRLREVSDGADGVLLTGVARGATAFRIEMRARNEGCLKTPDAEGVLRSERRLRPTGRAVLRSTAPVDAIAAALRADGLPAQLSSDAGDYLCNCTLYGALVERLDQAPAAPVAFLHLPPADVLGPDALEQGVRIAAAVMARTLAARPQASSHPNP